MTRQERLFFCKKCINRDFTISEGILCKLTGKRADFEGTCPDYELDKKTIVESTPKKAIQPNQKRADLAIYLIWAVLIIDLFTIVSDYMQYRLLQDLSSGADITDADLTANDLRVGLISVLYLVVYIISVVTFIQWFRRAYNNLGSRVGIAHDEGWAAGAWFVPIISLFRPYTIMKELFEKTDKLITDRTGLTVKDNGMTLVGIWWTLWIIVGFVANYSLKAAFKSDTIEDLSNSSIADMISSFLDIPIGILAIMIISSFAKKESQLLQLETEALL